MPSRQHDNLHQARTPCSSLEVLELSLENKELYRVREDSTWEQSEPADQPSPPHGTSSRHGHLPSPGQPGRCLHWGSFPLPADTMQDWAPWAKILCPGKRREVQPAFHFVIRLCLRAATASTWWSVDIGIYVQFYLSLILFYLKKKYDPKPRKSMVFSASGWHLTACSNYIWKVIDSVGYCRGWLVFGFVFIF